jgi:tRNA(fMet)-specific endonuclease VapC
MVWERGIANGIVSPVPPAHNPENTCLSRTLEAILGTFQNDPLYERAMRPGQQYPQSLRPKSPTRRQGSNRPMTVQDTDHLSVLERSDQPGSGALCARLTHLPPSDVVTTIISYEEQMRGGLAYLARTRSMAHQVDTHRRLLQHLDNYRRIPVLPFDEAAAASAVRLTVLPRDRESIRGLGRNDGHKASCLTSG